MSSPFTRKTLAFLRALKRNNDREWFRARKADYERDVRGPMLETLARLATDLPAFAPDLVADPRVSLFRMYRDTRFSADKSPLKTHIGARFPSRKFPKGAGAGLYFEIGPQWVWIGGGSYMPSPVDLRAIRSTIATQPGTLRRILSAKAFAGTVGGLQGSQLSRVPRGFPSDHPAEEYLRYKQFFAGQEFPPDFAITPDFYPQLILTFRCVVPLVDFLNQAMRPTAGNREG